MKVIKSLFECVWFTENKVFYLQVIYINVLVRTYVHVTYVYLSQLKGQLVMHMRNAHTPKHSSFYS